MGWLPDSPNETSATERSQLNNNSSALNNNSSSSTNGSDSISDFFERFSAENMYMTGWTYHMLGTVITSYGIYFGIGGLVHVRLQSNFCK